MKKMISILSIALFIIGCQKEECHVCTITSYPDNTTVNEDYCGKPKEYSKKKKEFYDNCADLQAKYPSKTIICDCD